MTKETYNADGTYDCDGKKYPSYSHYLASINAKPLESPALEPLQTPEQASQNEKVVHYCVMNKLDNPTSLAIAKDARPLILAGYLISIEGEDGVALAAVAPDDARLNAFGAPGFVCIHEATGGEPAKPGGKYPYFGDVEVDRNGNPEPLNPTPEPIERWITSDADIEQQREAAALSVITEFGQQEGLSITDTSLIYNNVKAAIDRGATLYIEGRRLWVREMEGTTADSVVEVNGGPGETWISYSGEAADPDKYLRRGIKPGIPTPEVELPPDPNSPEYTIADKLAEVRGERLATVQGEIPTVEVETRTIHGTMQTRIDAIYRKTGDDVNFTDTVNINGEIYDKRFAPQDPAPLDLTVGEIDLPGPVEIPDDLVSISDEARLRLYREQLAPEIAAKVVDDLLKSGRFEIRAHEAPAPWLGGSLPEERVETYKYRDMQPDGRPLIAIAIEHLDGIKEMTEVMGEEGRNRVADLLRLAANRLS